MKALYNKIKLELLFVPLLSLGVCSCEMLNVEPENVLAPETFYESDEDVFYGLTGVYGVINSEAFYGNYYSLMLSNVDDICYQNRAQSGSYPYWYTHTSSDTYIYQVWSKLYEGIKNANELMGSLDELSDLDESGQYYAEARFLRAYYHFILAQGWGDVPLRLEATTSPNEVEIAATEQVEVLEWCVEEMEAVLETITDGDLSVAPSRITRSAVQGILARVYLFLAGESVAGVADRDSMWSGAAKYAGAVVDSNLHMLNPDYAQVFINMIMDIYDTEYRESIWEAEFMGNHSSGSWSNGRIGDLIGLQSSSSGTNFSEWSCNYSYGQYNGSLKLWDLYWSEDRTDAERELESINDSRQEWNLPGYNYNGYASLGLVASYDKSPYAFGGSTTFEDPTTAGGKRNAGKYRREVIYEGQMSAKELYTQINFPILRYSDVLLMYAEASNEMGDMATAYAAVKQVRDRAMVETRSMGEYDKSSLRELIRNERGRELAFEALRKYDLIRWGIFVEEMNNYSVWAADEDWAGDTTATRAATIGGNVQAKHIVFPIPSIELGVNKLLKQNALW